MIRSFLLPIPGLYHITTNTGACRLCPGPPEADVGPIGDWLVGGGPLRGWTITRHAAAAGVYAWRIETLGHGLNLAILCTDAGARSDGWRMVERHMPLLPAGTLPPPRAPWLATRALLTSDFFFEHQDTWSRSIDAAVDLSVMIAWVLCNQPDVARAWVYRSHCPSPTTALSLAGTSHTDAAGRL